MAGFGSKEAFYRDLRRDAWAPLGSRRDVKQALLVLVIGLFCVGGGGYALLLSADITPFFAGLAFTGWGASTLWQYRGAWRAWRGIGDVALAFADDALVAGEVGTFEIVVRPRRTGVVQAASLTIWCRDSRGPAACAPWHQGLVFDADVPTTPLARGTETRIPVLVAVDPAAPPSRFERDVVRQWCVLAELTLTDGRRWTREYPVFLQAAPAGAASITP